MIWQVLSKNLTQKCNRVHTGLCDSRIRWNQITISNDILRVVEQSRSTQQPLTIHNKYIETNRNNIETNQLFEQHIN